jgi:hypothetical protein
MPVKQGASLMRLKPVILTTTSLHSDHEIKVEIHQNSPGKKCYRKDLKACRVAISRIPFQRSPS